MCEKGTMGKSPSRSRGYWIEYVVLGVLLALPLGILQADTSVTPRAAINSASEDTANVMREAEEGIQNARRLLPVGKKLMLQALRDCQRQMGVYDSNMETIATAVNAIDSIGIDVTLWDLAEVDDERPNLIMVGPEYASLLTSDDEVMMLLGHELTHIAARDERLKSFVSVVTLTVERLSGVYPTDDQQEDLAADYIGEQTLRRYILAYPTDEPGVSRLSRVLGVDPGAGEVFDDGGDDEHLAHIQMVQAWLALDRELAPVARR